MEPEDSWPHSQVPAICPYPVPDQSSPYPGIPLPADPSQYYPPFYPLTFQVVSSLVYIYRIWKFQGIQRFE